MAFQQVPMWLALMFTAILWAGTTTAQSDDCTNVLISMSPCLNYISGNSSTPATACCTQLRSVIGSQPKCLCQVLNGGGSNLGLNINQTQALTLPRACNVETPSPTQCSASSPSGSPDSAPNSPNTGSENGSKTLPPGDGSSGAASSKMCVTMLLPLLLVASYF